LPDPTVLILGCGIGGVVAARELRNQLPAPFRIIVIDREARASFPPSYLWVATGDRRPQSITRQRPTLSRHGIEFVTAEVRLIDVANRYVRADSREFHYDYLVIALGAETTLETRPGLAEHAHSFYSLEGAERLGATLRYFGGGRVVIAITSLPYKCPPAPYEAAMLIEHFFHSRRMRQKVEIELHTPEANPLGVAGPQVSSELRGLLAHKGIEFVPESRIASVGGHEAVFLDGSRAAFQLLIAVPEHRAPAVVREAGLTGAAGWVDVEPATMETRFENVFALGDVVHVPLPGGMALPKAGVFAQSQARTVVANIVHRARGGPAPEPFDGFGRCLLEVGANNAAVVEGDFLGGERPIEFKQPSMAWHLMKLAYERYWLWRTY